MSKLKNIFIFILVISLTLALVSCGENSANDSDAATTVSSMQNETTSNFPAEESTKSESTEETTNENGLTNITTDGQTTNPPATNKLTIATAKPPIATTKPKTPTTKSPSSDSSKTPVNPQAAFEKMKSIGLSPDGITVQDINERNDWWINKGFIGDPFTASDGIFVGGIGGGSTGAYGGNGKWGFGFYSENVEIWFSDSPSGSGDYKFYSIYVSYKSRLPGSGLQISQAQFDELVLIIQQFKKTPMTPTKGLTLQHFNAPTVEES